MKITSNTEWYHRAFNQRYLELYSHRDEKELAQLFFTLVHFKLFPTDGKVLDAACGAGRWLRYLIRNGVDAIGFDLSSELLKECSDLPVVQADMRSLPFEDQTFISVHSLFSSFGYFVDAEEDMRQIREFVRVLKKDGWILFDTIPDRFLYELPPDNTYQFSDGVIASIHRETKQNIIYKTVQLDNGEMWEERLRVYTPIELDQMFQKYGCCLLWRLGNYDGSSYNANYSPRMISCYVRTT
ncbi:MAG: class I SAM-dependent methyltransferase [bacterium]|nr:class I SAM-dependent methyltransferase [bacterium]